MGLPYRLCDWLAGWLAVPVSTVHVYCNFMCKNEETKQEVKCYCFNLETAGRRSGKRKFAIVFSFVSVEFLLSEIHGCGWEPNTGHIPQVYRHFLFLLLLRPAKNKCIPTYLKRFAVNQQVLRQCNTISSIIRPFLMATTAQVNAVRAFIAIVCPYTSPAIMRRGGWWMAMLCARPISYFCLWARSNIERYTLCMVRAVE